MHARERGLRAVGVARGGGDADPEGVDDGHRPERVAALELEFGLVEPARRRAVAAARELRAREPERRQARALVVVGAGRVAQRARQVRVGVLEVLTRLERDQHPAAERERLVVAAQGHLRPQRPGQFVRLAALAREQQRERVTGLVAPAGLVVDLRVGQHLGGHAHGGVEVATPVGQQVAQRQQTVRPGPARRPAARAFHEGAGGVHVAQPPVEAEDPLLHVVAGDRGLGQPLGRGQHRAPPPRGGCARRVRAPVAAPPPARRRRAPPARRAARPGRGRPPGWRRAPRRAASRAGRSAARPAAAARRASPSRA